MSTRLARAQRLKSADQQPLLSRRRFFAGMGLFTLATALTGCGGQGDGNLTDSDNDGYAVDITSGETLDSDLYRGLTDALDDYTQTSGVAELGVTVYLYESDHLYVYNSRYSGYEASIVKIPIALTAMRLAFEQGENFTDEYGDFVDASIGWSDNDATTFIYSTLADTEEEQAEAINDTYDLLGISNTRIDGMWGVNLTNPQDQVTIARAIYEGIDWVSARDMQRLRNAMDVDNYTQEWGVGAFESDDRAQEILCKNGWITDDDGIWFINSTGLIKAKNETFAVCVMNNGFTVEEDGESLSSDVVNTVMDQLIN